MYGCDERAPDDRLRRPDILAKGGIYGNPVFSQAAISGHHRFGKQNKKQKPFLRSGNDEGPTSTVFAQQANWVKIADTVTTQ